MGKVIAEVSVVPLGTASPSLSVYVAEVERVLNSYPNLKSQLTPMATILEGELEEVLRALRAMHEAPFRQGALRVSTRLVIDERRDKDASLEQKVRAVKNKL